MPSDTASLAAPAQPVRRLIPGAPTSISYQQITSSLAFEIAVVSLSALGDGGTNPATAYDQGGKPMAVQPSGITYSSSDESIMTVDPVTGAITAIAVGIAVVIATIANARRGIATVTITQVPHTVTLDESSTTVALDDGTDRRAAAVTLDTDTADLALGTGDDRAASITLSSASVTLSLA